MTNVQSALRAEISRLARKEIKGEISALKKSNLQHRSHIAALRKKIEALERALKKVGRTKPERAAADEDDAEGATARRFSAARLAKTRQKLGLSAADFGALLGVSGQSIYKWEGGEARPRRKQLEAIAQVRGLGKREAAARLEVLRQAPVSEKPAGKRSVSKRRAAAAPAARKRA
jgi:DNA-binding transcriptional regulator YiaG